MLNMYPFGAHDSLTRLVLSALDQGINKLNTFEDAGDALEHAEELAGLAFLALQQHIRASSSVLRRCYPDLKASDSELRQKNCDSISGTTYVEGVWAAGNYFKHHDEWPDWSPEGSRAYTITVLAKLEITQATCEPCFELAMRLQGGLEIRRQGRSLPLTKLLPPIVRWRDAWLSELESGKPS